MLIGYVFPRKKFHVSNLIEVGLGVYLQLQFEASERTKTHSTSKMTKCCTRVKIDIDDPLYDNLHYQVKIFLKTWEIEDNMGDTFVLE